MSPRKQLSRSLLAELVTESIVSGRSTIDQVLELYPSMFSRRSLQRWVRLYKLSGTFSRRPPASDQLQGRPLGRPPKLTTFHFKVRRCRFGFLSFFVALVKMLGDNHPFSSVFLPLSYHIRCTHRTKSRSSWPTSVLSSCLVGRVGGFGRSYD